MSEQAPRVRRFIVPKGSGEPVEARAVEPAPTPESVAPSEPDAE
jgi:hypothetical protein